MASSLGRNFILFLALLYTVALTMGSLIKPVTIVDRPFQSMDKVMHLVAYFGLFLLWSVWQLFVRRDLVGKKKMMSLRKIMTITAVVAVAYGIIIEVCQGLLTDYRTPDGWDILANTTGVLLGVLVLHLFINNIESLKSKF
ncbi:VanZ family protein [Dokdonia sinensis]|nr:VanZ family protein [Dokdonia sinensis]